MTEPGFKRLWSTPRRLMREYTSWTELTPRGRYLREQSRARYDRRPDAYQGDQAQLTGELGRIESFRFITSPMPYQRMRLGDDAGAALLEGLTFKVAPLHFEGLPPDQLGLALAGYAPIVSTTAAELALKMRAGAEQLDRACVLITSLNGPADRDDWIGRGYLAAARSGTSAMMIGMDMASGPDWSVVTVGDYMNQVHTRPGLTPLDIARITAAEVKRARRRMRQRRLAAKGAIGRA